jgi:hypothetical protein
MYFSQYPDICSTVLIHFHYPLYSSVPLLIFFCHSTSITLSPPVAIYLTLSFSSVFSISISFFFLSLPYLSLFLSLSSSINNLSISNSPVSFKGTVPQDFSPKLFFMKHIRPLIDIDMVSNSWRYSNQKIFLHCCQQLGPFFHVVGNNADHFPRCGLQRGKIINVEANNAKKHT